MRLKTQGQTKTFSCKKVTVCLIKIDRIEVTEFGKKHQNNSM